MHPQKVTAWRGFWAGACIGSYCFEEDVGETITVNGERYRRTITNFLIQRHERRRYVVLVELRYLSSNTRIRAIVRSRGRYLKVLFQTY